MLSLKRISLDSEQKGFEKSHKIPIETLHPYNDMPICVFKAVICFL